jgi:hypothetical protein
MKAARGQAWKYLLMGALILASPWAGACTLAIRAEADRLRTVNSGILSPLEQSGFAGLIPPGDLGACGPNPAVAALIPDCPLPETCFTIACAQHDVCYSTCGTREEDCDRVFFWDMVYLCDSTQPPWGVDACYRVAYIYYRVVARYGPLYYPATQDYTCGFPPSPAGAAASTRVMNPVESPFADEDGDLMPDDWEILSGLNPADAGDGLLDYDGDGLVNLAEYTHGTDPYVRSAS